ncbi:MAG: alpha/beta hydrolase [Lachnospiraceae bacterium]|nr:alpha/beta hydrolase [Lachnospiraceae bacterium]
MLHETYPIRVEGSAPDAKLITYIQEYSPAMKMNIRPLILICPGGGYGYTSDREAESMALQFLAMGYHAAVLRYSCAPAQYPTALLELASSVKLIREHAKEWNIAEDKIVVQGCSAGGHLAASFGTFWHEDFIAQTLQIKDKEILRPNGMVLCYPVITSGEYAHRGSFNNLLGDRQELLEKMSLEKQVNENTPQAFIWHTFEDGSVPVENSLLLVGAMRKAGIPVEFHLYPHGGHGLGLATKLTETEDGRAVQPECASWIGLAHTWLEGLFA